MFLYILMCRNGRYYIGSTTDLERRLQEHKNGKNTSTKHLLPVELVFKQEYPKLVLARKAEYWIKKQKDRALIDRIVKEGILRREFL